MTVRPIAGTRKRGATRTRIGRLRPTSWPIQGTGETLCSLDSGATMWAGGGAYRHRRPTETFIIERYSHVMHIVSNVVGEIAEGEDALSALLGGLPPATVQVHRKCGRWRSSTSSSLKSAGLRRRGRLLRGQWRDGFCIALRTAVLKDETLYIQAGGGVGLRQRPRS